jgi:hypothetical protein
MLDQLEERVCGASRVTGAVSKLFSLTLVMG